MDNNTGMWLSTTYSQSQHVYCRNFRLDATQTVTMNSRLGQSQQRKYPNCVILTLPEENPRMTSRWPHKWPAMRKLCSCRDIIVRHNAAEIHTLFTCVQTWLTDICSCVYGIDECGAWLKYIPRSAFLVLFRKYQMNIQIRLVINYTRQISWIHPW